MTITAAESGKTEDGNTIIYTVDYGPKPPFPPSLEPVFDNNYLTFEDVYVVMDNWYYASRERADSVDADAFLIKGGSTSDVPFYDGSLDSYVALLRNPGRPTFGFCAGHQFLQMARGGICARRSGERGYQTATILEYDEVLNGVVDSYEGWAAHSYSIVDIPDAYRNYAVTRTCYSTFVKHVTMPLYGTQLHLESGSHPSAEGQIILSNFRNHVMPRKFHGVAEAAGYPSEPGKVLLTWWRARTDEEVLYHIYHATGESALDFTSPSYETSELHYEITGLAPDITHYFGVRAVSPAFQDSNRAIYSIKPDGHHEITFQNGVQNYEGCEATVLYNKYPDSNYGLRGSTEDDTLFWWDSGLVQFKGLEQQLAGKTIIGGKLTFIFAGGVSEFTNSSHAANITIHQILKPWNEGQGRDHSDAQSGEVTWNSAQHNVATWEIPGCRGGSDRAENPLASYTIQGDGTGIAFDGTVELPPELLQTWVDNPESNCGVLFEKTDTYPTDDYFYFEDNENNWFMNRPRLIVYYTENPATVVTSTTTKTIPATIALSQNHPNPFNQSTKISFRTAEAGRVSLSVYNLRGQLVRKLLEETLSAGLHQVHWDGYDASGAQVSSGIYIYALVTNETMSVKRMLLLR